MKIILLSCERRATATCILVSPHFKLCVQNLEGFREILIGIIVLAGNKSMCVKIVF